jgi:hypothetical protein
MTVSINGTSGLVFNDASTQATAATGFGFKNRIINGAMMISQRGTSFTPSNGDYTLDRWQGLAAQSSKYTVAQSSTAPSGFINSLLVTSSSAYSVGASDYFDIVQYVEGLNISDLGWGTASAKTVTLSFQVYSSLTGTFGGSLQNNGQTRSYPFSYTISSANTWTTISVTIAGDTSGTWLTTNGRGIQLNFSLGTGSTFSGTAGSWATANYLGTTGATSVVGTSGATFYITGVQLEKGSTSTSFDYRPYGTELALCQRYYETNYNIGNAVGSSVNQSSFVVGIGSASTTIDGCNSINYKVAKRSDPSIAFWRESSTTASTWDYFGNVNGTATPVTQRVTQFGFGLYTTNASGLTVGYPYSFRGMWAASSEL